MKREDTAEYRRLKESDEGDGAWRSWGGYVADRSWGTVREDYSENGEFWSSFTYDDARSRAYRWTEDGIGGFCDEFQHLILATTFWNEKDSHLKERFFGLSNDQGNHGEDVKELYFYVDATPTHSYLKMLYKYPQVAFPYKDLLEQNEARGYEDPEYDLIDAIGDVFEQGRYFDITIEWAKVTPEDIIGRITVHNRGPDPAPLHILPHFWARNTWSWGRDVERPDLHIVDSPAKDTSAVYANEKHLGERWWYVKTNDGKTPSLLFTENDTNKEQLFNAPNATSYVKDAFHAAVVDGQNNRVNPDSRGTKTTAHIQTEIGSGEAYKVWIRFSPEPQEQPFQDLEALFDQRIAEADEFYNAVHHPELTEEERLIQRQAFAGLIWTEQYYFYSVHDWLEGDPATPPPPPPEKRGRNQKWRHFYALDIISMPDKWEYPWFASWDLAFHTLPLGLIDIEFAKDQLMMLLHEWYQHPNGKVPSNELELGGVMPPVQAWAAWRLYHLERSLTGQADTVFLERAFQKLTMNFTWWVNQEDQDQNNVFQGGVLGMDNIGIFEQREAASAATHIDQADGTAWMGAFCLSMLRIAIELSQDNPAYQDMAHKFFGHFMYIAHSLANLGAVGAGVWDPEDGFYYDLLHLPTGKSTPLKIRSFVGLIPLLAVETIHPETLERLPKFRERMAWFMQYRSHLIEHMAPLKEPGQDGRLLLALANREQLTRVLQRMLDSNEFLSPYGLRSLSKYHEDHPYTFKMEDEERSISYDPGVSRVGLLGGNSNWRGPIWFPVNFLLIEALRTYDLYYGDSLKVEYPTGSGHRITLAEVADELSNRLIGIYRAGEDGARPFHGDHRLFRSDPETHDLLLFYEYFHGDTGRGLGAGHQTGWTALIAKLVQEHAGGETCVSPVPPAKR